MSRGFVVSGRLQRPPSSNPHSELLHVRITPAMSEWIDRISEARLDEPTQAVIVREALAEYIERFRKAEAAKNRATQD